jgi:hypothetical protein
MAFPKKRSILKYFKQYLGKFISRKVHAHADEGKEFRRKERKEKATTLAGQRMHSSRTNCSIVFPNEFSV